MSKEVKKVTGGVKRLFGSKDKEPLEGLAEKQKRPDTPLEMPSIDDEQVQRARKLLFAKLFQRRGRESTMLTRRDNL